ncbi:MAG: hypothetical protein VYE54_10665, partial [Pseudomonadota bacterium]|nr:hypothetical protein [Pseudomonadota bacterium]
MLIVFAVVGILPVLPAQAGAVDLESKSITLALATEPPTLHSARATDTIASFVISHMMEGLLR